MRYGILGTGDVAHAIATKLIGLGHEVMMGARSVTNEKALSWAKSNGERAFNGTFADAARFGERVFNCVQGIHSLEALNAAGKENLNGKLLTLNPQLHSRSATYIKRNGLLIRKITIKSSRPFQCAYHPLTP